MAGAVSVDGFCSGMKSMCREAFGVPFSVEEKTALYKRAGGKCENPYGCPTNERRFYALTIDHITPQCLAKHLGWTLAQMDHHDNLNLLCQPCHIIKDSETERELSNVRFLEKRGHGLGIGRERFHVRAIVR